MATPNAIAVFSSSRRDGNTGQLMDRLAGELYIDVVDLAEKNISAYDYEHRNRRDDFEPLIEHILGFEQIIFASPVYWYAVTPPMKAFLDRIADLLDLAELLDVGRQLRDKRTYVVCTSIYDDVPPPFIVAFQETFNYLGMQFGGYLHANCRDGYTPERYEQDIKKFIGTVSNAANEKSD
jgi:multimeric flavodoxin WrbA